MPTPTEEGPNPYWNPWVERRAQTHREIAAIVAEHTPPANEPDDIPDGHFTEAPEHEVATYLAKHHRYTGRYRPEHPDPTDTPAA